jgi:hypothetical protein
MFQSPYFNVGMFGTNCITNLVDPQEVDPEDFMYGAAYPI